VQRLERQRQAFEEQRDALANEAEELRELRARVEAEHEDVRGELEAELERETIALRANVSKIRAELLAARDRLKREAQDPKALRSIERDLGRAAVHVSLGGSLLPRREEAAPAAARAPSIVYKSGDSVRVKSSGLLATVIDADNDKLRIQVGSIKLILRSEDVEPARAPRSRRSRSTLPNRSWFRRRFPRRSAPAPTRSICAANASMRRSTKSTRFSIACSTSASNWASCSMVTAPARSNPPCALTCRLPATLNSPSPLRPIPGAMRSRSSGYGASVRELHQCRPANPRAP
jgi:hypothetical protein